MERLDFIMLINSLKYFNYDDQMKIALLKDLSNELKIVDEKRRKLIFYVFTHFCKSEERSILLNAIKSFPQDRLQALEVIILMEKTDVYKKNNVENCKKVIELARSTNEEKFYEFIKILYISRYIFNNDTDVFEFVLNTLKSFDISKFNRCLKSADELYSIDELMSLRRDGIKLTYDLDRPMHQIPTNVDLDSIDSQQLEILQKNLILSIKPD